MGMHSGVMLFLCTLPEAQWGQLNRLLWGIPLAFSYSVCTVALACGLELALMTIGAEGHQSVRGSQAEPPEILRNLQAPWDEWGTWAFRLALAVTDLPTHIYHARAAVCTTGVAHASRSSFVFYVSLLLPYFWV